ncbi:MAG: flagellar hook-associated protein FlgL [Chitinivibrionales bacterium]
MRVTFSSLNRNVQNVINNRYGELTDLQQQMATGKRLLRPSDDPVDTSNDLKLRSKVKQLKQYKKNIEDGLGFMSVADTSMISMNDIMQRVRELSIQGANDTLSADERMYIAKEVEHLTRQVVSLLNTQYKGEYVFGGKQTKIAPFPLTSSDAASAEDYTNLKMAYYDASALGTDTPVQIRDAFTNDPITNIIPGDFTISYAGTTMVENRDYTVDYANGTITFLSTGPHAATLADDMSPGSAGYQEGELKMTFDYVGRGRNVYGDVVSQDGNISREIEAGIIMPINISGSEILQDPATGVNTLETLLDFGQSLIQNDRQGIQDSIGRIDDVMQLLLGAQSTNGARINRFEITQERNELQSTETSRRQSELEDADYAEVVTEFSLAQTVYNAALKSTSKIIQPSLADFL